MPCSLVVFDARRGAREGDDEQKLLASYPSSSAASTRAIVGLAGGLIAYGAAWEGIGDDDDDVETEIDADDQSSSSSLSAVPPLPRGFAVHLERSRWVMHRASPGVWWLLIADAAWIGQSSPTDASLQGAAAAAANVATLLTGPVERLLMDDSSEKPLAARAALAGPVAALGAALFEQQRRQRQRERLSSPLASAALEGAFRPAPASCARAAAATGPRLAAAAASAGAALLDDFEGKTEGGPSEEEGSSSSPSPSSSLAGVWISRCAKGGDADAGLLWTNVSPRDAAAVALLAALGSLYADKGSGGADKGSGGADKGSGGGGGGSSSSSSVLSSAADAAARAASDVASRFSGLFSRKAKGGKKLEGEGEEEEEEEEEAEAEERQATAATPTPTAPSPSPPFASPSCAALDPSCWLPLDPSDPLSLLGVSAPSPEDSRAAARARPLRVWLRAGGGKARVVATPALVPAATLHASLSSPSSRAFSASSSALLSRAPYRALLFLEGHGEEEGEEESGEFLSSLARGAFAALVALPAAAAADAAASSSAVGGGEAKSSDPFDAAATLGPGGHVRGARYCLEDLAGGLGWATPSAKADTLSASSAPGSTSGSGSGSRHAGGGGGGGGGLRGALALGLSFGARTLTQPEAALGAAASEGLGWAGEAGDAEVLVRPAAGGGFGGGGKAAAAAAATTLPPPSSSSASGGTWACASRCGARSLTLLLRPGGVRGGDDAAAAAAALAAFAERRCGGGLE